MKNIRRSVFETNSSSTHSISVSSDSDGLLQTLPVAPDGTITLGFGQFGWEWEKYNDAWTKANYAAISAVCALSPDKKEMLINVIKDHTGAKEVVFYNDDQYNYIDHQSLDGNTLKEAFSNETSLKNWLFNPKSWLFLGNDNESYPPNFFDEPNKLYHYKITLENCYQSAKLTTMPDFLNPNEEFISTLCCLLDSASDYKHNYYIPDEYSDKDRINSLESLKDGYITLFDVAWGYPGKDGKPQINSTKKLKINIEKI